MAFKDIAQYGYAQTVAGTWDLGSGVRLSFGIQDARAERFQVEIFGPTTDQMVRRRQIAQLAGVSLEGPSGDDTGANLRPSMSGPGALAIVLANAISFAASFNERKHYTRVRHTAFALGAPITHGDQIWAERHRSHFRSVLQNRGGRLPWDNLDWVAEHYMSVIDSGPYFYEENGRAWRTAGFIVIPHGQPAALGSSVDDPADILMRVRTDVAGQNLYLEAHSTFRHRVTATRSGVYRRAGAIVYGTDDVQTIE
jgi:hypothetical protein